jgi:hypothetical protein
MNATMIPTVPTQMATALGIDVDNIRVNATRWGLKPDDYRKDEALKEDTAVKLITKFAETSRKEGVKAKANALLVNHGLITDISLRKITTENVSNINGKSQKKAISRKKRSKTINKTNEKFPLWLKVIMGMIVIVAMVVQMSHTAVVCNGGGEVSSNWPINWAYAFAIQFTGLMLTAVKGKRSYLVFFAVCEFLINMLFYEPWLMEVSKTITSTHVSVYWFRSILLSGLLSFTIFSYSEVLSALSNIHKDD